MACFDILVQKPGYSVLFWHFSSKAWL